MMMRVDGVGQADKMIELAEDGKEYHVHIAGTRQSIPVVKEHAAVMVEVVKVFSVSELLR